MAASVITNAMTYAFNCECDNYVHEIVSFTTVKKLFLKSGFPYAERLAHSVCNHGIFKKRGDSRYSLRYISVNAIQPLLVECQEYQRKANLKSVSLKGKKIADAIKFLENNGYVVSKR